MKGIDRYTPAKARAEVELVDFMYEEDPAFALQQAIAAEDLAERSRGLAESYRELRQGAEALDLGRGRKWSDTYNARRHEAQAGYYAERAKALREILHRSHGSGRHERPAGCASCDAEAEQAASR
jgi:hypothetical protein